jgi:hypothetical protein
MKPQLATYAEFWPHYLRAHKDKRTRALHFVGTGLALALVLTAILAADWRYLVAAPIVGYAFAWVAHFAIEGNKPATFGHPFWSFGSDVRMLYLFLLGRLDPELDKAGIRRIL